MLKSSIIKVELNPTQIVYLKFLLEGYDHLALPIVVDGKRAEIKMLVHPSEAEILIALIREEFPPAAILRDE